MIKLSEGRFINEQSIISTYFDVTKDGKIELVVLTNNAVFKYLKDSPESRTILESLDLLAAREAKAFHHLRLIATNLTKLTHYFTKQEEKEDLN